MAGIGSRYRRGPGSSRGRRRDNKNERGWRARLHAPTEKYPYHRVRFKDPAGGGWVDRPVSTGEDPDEHFDKVEAALEGKVAQPTRAAAPTMTDLAACYLEWLRDQGCDDEYVHNRKNILTVWVLRDSGRLPVHDWCPEHTQAWIGAIRRAGSQTPAITSTVTMAATLEPHPHADHGSERYRFVVIRQAC